MVASTVVVARIEVVENRLGQPVLAVEPVEELRQRPGDFEIADRIEAGVGAERREQPRVGVAQRARGGTAAPSRARRPSRPNSYSIADLNLQRSGGVDGSVRPRSLEDRARSRRRCNPPRRRSPGRGRRAGSRARGRTRAACAGPQVVAEAGDVHVARLAELVDPGVEAPAVLDRHAPCRAGRPAWTWIVEAVWRGSCR